MNLRFTAWQAVTWATVAGAMTCAALLAVLDERAPALDGSPALSALWPPGRAGLPSTAAAASASAARWP